MQNYPVLLLILLFALLPTQSVLGIPGLPGSPDFGSGAVIFPAGHSAQEALVMADNLDVDWVKLAVAWDQFQPDSGSSPHWSTLDGLVRAAELEQIALMLSISDPPDWALSPDGPDAEKSAEFAGALAQRYPGLIQAVELYPGANTSQSWKGKVSAEAYFEVFRAASAELHRIDPKILVVAAGLRPTPEIPLQGDMPDLEFLTSLYAMGAADWMPVISLDYSELTGSPTMLPSSRETRVLRHYEQVRRIMVENQHNSGIIWITQFNLPSGTIELQDLHSLNNRDAQAAWLSQAFDLFRAQLYIGVAFLPSLNSNGEDTAAQVIRFTRGYEDGDPFYSAYRKITGEVQGSILEETPGKHKAGSLKKKRPLL